MIPIFRGDYFFLSNFYLTDIKWNDRLFISAEHFYQASKCRKQCDANKINDAATSKSAKVLGRFVEKKPHWDVDRIRVMERILRAKFQNKKLKRMLLETGDKHLIDQNYYHDIFWGVCGCSKHKRCGLNMVGKILMKIRDDIAPSKPTFPLKMKDFILTKKKIEKGLISFN